MSSFRYEEIYQSDEGTNGERLESRTPAHRPDESPTGYSLASCSPAELASASSAARHAATNNTCSSSYFQRTVTGEFLYCLK